MRLTSPHHRRWHRPDATGSAGPAGRTAAIAHPAQRTVPLGDVASPPANPPMTGPRPVSVSTVRRHRPWGWRHWLLAVQMAVLAAVLTAATPAQAETTHVVALAAQLTDVLTNIRNWIMGILVGIAVVFFTWGGLRYIFASGDPGEVEKAKSAFKNAGYGFALAALAPLIVAVLQGIVGGT